MAVEICKKCFLVLLGVGASFWKYLENGWMDLNDVFSTLVHQHAAYPNIDIMNCVLKCKTFIKGLRMKRCRFGRLFDFSNEYYCMKE